MTRGTLTASGVSMALAACALATLDAQTPARSAAAKTAWSAKTPWGDPDLQGTWTSDAALGIPLQRPAQFAGRAELNDDEYKQKVERDTRTRTAAENAVGSFRGDGAWLNKSFRQTSLIVEPADGQIPPITPDAEKRRAT